MNTAIVAVAIGTDALRATALVGLSGNRLPQRVEHALGAVAPPSSRPSSRRHCGPTRLGTCNPITSSPL
jgi:hypothetical protein